MTSENDTVAKQSNFYAFTSSLLINYWATFLFILIIILLLVILKYAQDKLDFPESKLILNWFGIVVIGNLFVTYSIIMTYQSVKNQQGFVGPSGYQGPIGDFGESDYCNQCKEKLDIMEPDYEMVSPPQPLMPNEIIVERTKVKPTKMPVNPA
jgi:hypothetical protein